MFQPHENLIEEELRKSLIPRHIDMQPVDVLITGGGMVRVAYCRERGTSGLRIDGIRYTHLVKCLSTTSIPVSEGLSGRTIQPCVPGKVRVFVSADGNLLHVAS